VGIVLDFGLPGDAPAGETPHGTVAGCVHVPDGATGMDVLMAAVGSGGVRIGTGADVGLVCGIAGYPRSECAPVVDVAQPTQPTQPTQPSRQPAISPTPDPAPKVSANATAPNAGVPSPAATASVPAFDPSASDSLASAAASAATPAAHSGAESGAPSAAPTASGVPVSSLASLRHAAHKKSPIAAIVVAAFVVLLGAAAAWRAKARR